MADQALDNQPPNLAAMFQYLPAIAAYQSGAQQGMVDQNNDLIQQAFMGNEAFQQQKRPLDLAELASRTAVHQASAGLTNEQAAAARLANAFTGSTQPSKIKATNATNDATTVGADVKKLEAQGQLYGQLASQMADMTPWERVALVKKHLGDRLPDHPAIEAGLLKNADKLQDWMTKLSDDSYAQTAQARKAQADENKRLEMIRLQGDNQAFVEQMKIDGRYDLAKMKGDLQPKKQESMTQWEARMRDAANKGDVEAQAAIASLNADQQKKAAMSALVGDDLKRGLLKLGPSTALTPRPAPTPSPTQNKSPVGVPSGSGSDFPAILARDIANGGVPEGAADGEVAKMNPDQRKTFVKELWINKALKANPGMSREAIEAKGKELKKF